MGSFSIALGMIALVVAGLFGRNDWVIVACAGLVIVATLVTDRRQKAHERQIAEREAALQQALELVRERPVGRAVEAPLLIGQASEPDKTH